MEKAGSFGNYGGWNEKQESSQEYELLFRILKLGGEVLIRHQLTRWSGAGNSISTTDSQGKLEERRFGLQIYKFFRKHFPELAAGLNI